MMRPFFLSSIAWLVFLVQALAADSDQTSKPSRGTLSIATYNILYLNRDLPTLVATIRQADADVLALQETNVESERYLRRQLQNVYPHLLFRPSKNKSNGFAFLSRLPLGDAEFLGSDPEGRGGWMVHVRMGTNQLRLISVHFTTPRIPAEGTLPDMIKAFARCEQIHQQELTPVVTKIVPGRPTIVLGDFNSFSFGVAVKSLVDQGLIDSFASVTADAEQHGTWSPPGGLRPNKEMTLRLDFVLHDPSFKTISSRVLRTPASDHAMVISKLEW